MRFRYTGQDYYKVLGVAPTANAEEIQRAYNKLARQYHPDMNAGQNDEKKEENQKKFVEATEAFEVLNDADKRSQYDSMRSADASGSTGRSERTTSGHSGRGKSNRNHNPRYESYTTNDWHTEEDWPGWGGNERTHQRTDEPDFSEASFQEAVHRYRHDNDAAGWEILHALDPTYNYNSEYVSWTKPIPDPIHQRINMHLWFASPGQPKEKTDYFINKQLQNLRASLTALGAKNISSPERFGRYDGEPDLTFSIDATSDPRLVQLFDGYWDYRSPRAAHHHPLTKHFLKKAWMMSGLKTPDLFKHDEFKDHLKELLREYAPWQLIGPKGNDVLRYVGMDVKHTQPIPQFENSEPPIPPQAFTNFYIAALEMLGINIEGKRASSPFTYGNPDAGASSRNQDFIIIKDPDAFKKIKEMGIISEELATQANYGKHSAQARRSSGHRRLNP